MQNHISHHRLFPFFKKILFFSFQKQPDQLLLILFRHNAVVLSTVRAYRAVIIRAVFYFKTLNKDYQPDDISNND